jgi:2-haloacid dehalogenase
MRKYTTLLLDADDTLLDFHKAEAMAIETVCENFGIKYNEEVRQTYSEINAKLWRRLEKGEITRDVIKIRRFEEFAEITKNTASPFDMAQCYINALSKGGYLINGAKELCQELSKKYSLYIVTNGIATVQKSRLKLCGLLPYFNGVFISEEAGSQKPDKKFFDFVFNTIPEKDRSKVCIIGDSMSSDILGGLNAGIDTCYFCRNIADNLYTPTYSAQKYEDVKKIFLETEQG